MATTEFVKSIHETEISVLQDAPIIQTEAGAIRRGEYEDQVVIIKPLLKWNPQDDPTSTETALNVFKQEAAFFNDVKHARIVKLIGIMAETFSIVLEYMSEGSLDIFIQSKPLLSWLDRHTLMMDVAEGMAYLHAQVISNPACREAYFHKNLSSANILLEHDRKGQLRAKITGFGFTAVKEVASHQTILGKEGKIRGLYSAPELQQSTKFTYACDVYSYGMVMLELALWLRPKEAIVDFQDKLDKNQSPLFITMLIIECLELTPQKRPRFKAIYETLEKKKPDMLALNERLKKEKEKPVEVTSLLPVLDVVELPRAKPSASPSKNPFYEPSKKPSMRSIGQRKTLVILISIALLVFLIIVFIAAAFSTRTPPTVTTTPLPTFLPTTTEPILNTTKNQSMWGGVNYYFMHTLPLSEIDSTIQALKQANVKVVRIYLCSTNSGMKGSRNYAVNDVERSVGVYDDTILVRVDTLMKKLSDNDMKLIIALHDRNTLGCYGIRDAYVNKYNFPPATSSLSTSCTLNITQFYRNPEIIRAYEARISYILNHVNAEMNNKPWKELGDVIYSFNVQSEPMSYMPRFDNDWVCSRAQFIKTILPLNSPILVSTGGGSNFAESLGLDYFQCDAIDMVSIHSMSPNRQELKTGLDKAKLLSAAYNKSILFESFGKSTMPKDSFFADIMGYANMMRIPWMVWAVTNPGNNNDFEFYTSDVSAWNVLTEKAYEAINLN